MAYICRYRLRTLLISQLANIYLFLANKSLIHKDHRSPTPGPAQDILEGHTMCLTALSKCVLNCARLGTVTTFLGEETTA